MSALFMGPDLQLPWSVSEADDARFRRFLRNGVLAFVVVAAAVPFLPVKEITREQQEALPPQLARVMMEQKKLPPPPPPEPKKPVKPVEKLPKEKKLPEKKPVKKAPDKVVEAKKQAEVAGVMAFQDDLMAMRESLDVEALNSQPVSQGEQSAAKVERAMITSGVSSGSGGIATAKLSRNSGGAALSGRATTRVDNDDAVAVAAQAAPGAKQTAGRSDESVRRVMDRNKGAIFSIYNRALRKDPSLQGRFVFEMVIASDGRVSEIKLLSSELVDAKLNAKILSRVRLINFGSSDAAATTVNYSFDFVPY